MASWKVVGQLECISVVDFLLIPTLAMGIQMYIVCLGRTTDLSLILLLNMKGSESLMVYDCPPNLY